MRDLGQVAYESYCESVGGVSKFTGDRLPEWQMQKPEIRIAWSIAGIAVRKEVLTTEPTPEPAPPAPVKLPEAIANAIGPADHLVITVGPLGDDDTTAANSAEWAATIGENIRERWPALAERVLIIANATAHVITTPTTGQDNT